MNTLLVFFALPVATIILAIVFERIWKCYKLVTAAVFAIYLIIVFALFDASFLVYAIIYTFLAFIASYLSMLFRKLNRRLDNISPCDDRCEPECRRHDREDNCNNGTNLLRISSSCGNGNSNDLLTISSECSRENDNNNDDDDSDCDCGCRGTSRNSEDVAITARVTPNSCNNGRTGNFRGCYRRRF